MALVIHNIRAHFNIITQVWSIICSHSVPSTSPFPPLLPLLFHFVYMTDFSAIYWWIFFFNFNYWLWISTKLSVCGIFTHVHRKVCSDSSHSSFLPLDPHLLHWSLFYFKHLNFIISQRMTWYSTIHHHVLVITSWVKDFSSVKYVYPQRREKRAGGIPMRDIIKLKIPKYFSFGFICVFSYHLKFPLVSWSNTCNQRVGGSEFIELPLLCTRCM